MAFQYTEIALKGILLPLDMGTIYRNNVISSTPPKCVGLQVAGYYLWALQRFYERQEERFLDLIWPQVGEVHDLDQVKDGKRGVLYTKRKPLNLAAFLKNRGPRI